MKVNLQDYLQSF